MKKLLNFLLIIALCIISNNVNSQDLITKKDGTDISAKVLEIKITEVKYKKFDNLSGPIFTMLKSDILMIRYENGTKDIFNETVSTETEKINEENSKVETNSVSGKKADFKYGELIEVKEITKGLMKGSTEFYQNGNTIKYMKLFRELEKIDVCSENMKIARKYRKRYVTLVFTAIVFANIPGKKGKKYFMLAIEDYNNSLKQ